MEVLAKMLLIQEEVEVSSGKLLIDQPQSECYIGLSSSSLPGNVGF